MRYKSNTRMNLNIESVHDSKLKESKHEERFKISYEAFFMLL